ncbi:hypothetical protein [Micromonospora sp. NPDC049240]|uniref:hypothetical protein n=1 Tax=Micromonospora sp. NPDC049240 TaxID=3155151 RepID=UPI0033EA0F06
MTAQGKANAANISKAINRGITVRILLEREDAEKLKGWGINREPGLVATNRKTGVLTLAVLEAETRLSSGAGYTRRQAREYRFRTTEGWTLWHSPIQTFILAPEDAPGIKRAHKEALELDKKRDGILAALEGMTGEELINVHRMAQDAKDVRMMLLAEKVMEVRNREAAELALLEARTAGFLARHAGKPFEQALESDHAEALQLDEQRDRDLANLAKMSIKELETAYRDAGECDDVDELRLVGGALVMRYRQVADADKMLDQLQKFHERHPGKSFEDARDADHAEALAEDARRRSDAAIAAEATVQAVNASESAGAALRRYPVVPPRR